MKKLIKKIIKPKPEEIKKQKEYLKNNLKKNFFLIKFLFVKTFEVNFFSELYTIIS